MATVFNPVEAAIDGGGGEAPATRDVIADGTVDDVIVAVLVSILGSESER